MKRPVNQIRGGGGFGQGIGLDHGVAHMEEAEGGAQWEEVGVRSGWLCSRFSAMTWWWRFEVIKAAFSLMWTVQFHPFFNIIHIVANQIRHRFIEKISNTFFFLFQIMFL